MDAAHGKVWTMIVTPTTRGLVYGAAAIGLTALTQVARRDNPPSPGEVTPREVAAKLATPVLIASGVAVAGSAILAFGPLPQPGNGSLLVGAIGGAALIGAGLGVAHLYRSMRDA